jgi:hypothetical protein
MRDTLLRTGGGQEEQRGKGRVPTAATSPADLPNEDLYARPQLVQSLDDCIFYHTMDVPGYGTVKGHWDLRAGIDDYLGRVNFHGKRVLDIGSASGFLCFHMERQGAEVVAYDLGGDQSHLLNIVPYTQCDYHLRYQRFQMAFPRLKNAFWLCHRAFQSSARMVYGDAYAVPGGIGPVNVATFGCVLLHLRDPFQGLASALRLVRETVIITEVGSVAPNPPRAHTTLLGRFWDCLRRRSSTPSERPSKPVMTFCPDFRESSPVVTWWAFTPEVLGEFIGILGFEVTGVTHHVQLFQGQPWPLFTVVGRRTRLGARNVPG